MQRHVPGAEPSTDPPPPSIAKEPPAADPEPVPVEEAVQVAVTVNDVEPINPPAPVPLPFRLPQWNVGWALKPSHQQALTIVMGAEMGVHYCRL